MYRNLRGEMFKAGVTVAELAKKIGISEKSMRNKINAEDYMDDVIEELATPKTAAMGKLDLEKKDLKLSGVLLDWVQELVTIKRYRDQ